MAAVANYCIWVHKVKAKTIELWVYIGYGKNKTRMAEKANNLVKVE